MPSRSCALVMRIPSKRCHQSDELFPNRYIQCRASGIQRRENAKAKALTPNYLHAALIDRAARLMPALSQPPPPFFANNPHLCPDVSKRAESIHHRRSPPRGCSSASPTYFFVALLVLFPTLFSSTILRCTAEVCLVCRFVWLPSD